MAPSQSRRRYRRDDDSVEMKIRFNPTLRTRLEEEADRRVVSMNLLVERAVETALDQWEKQKLT